MSNQKKKIIQSNKYLLTINNPLEWGYSHDKIKEILIKDFTTLDYFCMADEIGNKTNTLHTHVFVYLKSRVRLDKVDKAFPNIHIDKCKGTPSQIISYVRKDGKWELDEKGDTSVEGTFEEWGTRPSDSKGRRSDMQELYQMVVDGYTNAEILAINQDYILQIDKIDKIRTTILMDKFKDKRRIDLEVVYVYGKTGAGKTRDILDEHGDESVFRVSDYQHPFDAYACQPIMVFDEFRNSISISKCLQLCDVYPIELGARYSNKFACYNKLYIVSNWTLEQQFQDAQLHDRETWLAFLRRIRKVVVYTGIGEKSIYNSVEEYMNRGISFIPIETEFLQEEIPFEEKKNE